MLTVEKFGQIVRAERVRQKSTQGALEDATGVARGNISNIERGKYKYGPSLFICNNILDSLGLEFKIVRKKTDQR